MDTTRIGGVLPTSSPEINYRTLYYLLLEKSHNLLVQGLAHVTVRREELCRVNGIPKDDVSDRGRTMLEQAAKGEADSDMSAGWLLGVYRGEIGPLDRLVDHLTELGVFLDWRATDVNTGWRILCPPPLAYKEEESRLLSCPDGDLGRSEISSSELPSALGEIRRGLGISTDVLARRMNVPVDDVEPLEGNGSLGSSQGAPDGVDCVRAFEEKLGIRFEFRLIPVHVVDRPSD